jgi:hypothetical protein
MSDVVALTSIISGATVALGSVGATIYTGSARRRWQSREERSAELREVLDEAAASLARGMQSIGHAYAVIAPPAVPNPDVAMREIIALSDSLSTVWAAANRVALRRGPESPIARALRDAEEGMGQTRSAREELDRRPRQLGRISARVEACARRRTGVLRRRRPRVGAAPAAHAPNMGHEPSPDRLSSTVGVRELALETARNGA